MNTLANQIFRSLLLGALFTVFSLSTATAQTPRFTKPKIGNQLADGVIVRPVSAAATVVGFAGFLVTLPFSALGGNTKTAWKQMVEKPAGYTFSRPLGEFDKYGQF